MNLSTERKTENSRYLLWRGRVRQPFKRLPPRVHSYKRSTAKTNLPHNEIVAIAVLIRQQVA